MVDRVQFKGLREIEDVLRKMPERVAARVTGNALAAGARLIRDEAKSRVPVDTGELRDAIAVRRARGVRGLVFIGALKPTSRRLHLTEFGTSRSSARPFLRPAFDTRIVAALRIVRQKLLSGAVKEAAKLASTLVRGRR